MRVKGANFHFLENSFLEGAFQKLGLQITKVSHYLLVQVGLFTSFKSAQLQLLYLLKM